MRIRLKLLDGSALSCITLFALFVLIINNLFELKGAVFGYINPVTLGLGYKAFVLDQETDEISRNLQPSIQIRLAEALVKHIHELALRKLGTIILPLAHQRVAHTLIDAGS